MVRGWTLFICPKCGKVFAGPDVELNATAMTMPLSCPDCGEESLPMTAMDMVFHGVRRLFRTVRGNDSKRRRRL